MEIFVDQKPRVLLGLFEQGGTKQPVKGASVAVPITGEAARPAFRDPVTPALQFAALHLRKRRGGNEREGAQRTFLIPGVGLFQRTARRATELIYAFLRAPRIKPRLGFVEIAQRTFAREWPARIGQLLKS